MSGHYQSWAMSFLWLDGGQVHCQVMKIVGDGHFEARLNPCGTSALIQVDPRWMAKISVESHLMLRNFHIKWDDKPKLDATGDKAKVFLLPSAERGTERSFELFAGVSGWGQALQAFGHQTMVFVEGDEDTARCCGFSFGLPVFTANELLQKILDENFDEPSVIWGKVEDDDVWQCIGLLNCSWGCSSPPCQPWSNSGTQGGLNEPDGHIFLKTLEMTGNLKVKVLLAENVKGFATHRDFRNLITTGKLFGMKLVLSGVFPCHKVSPIQRDRWLGTFMADDVTCDISKAQALSLSDVRFVGVTCPTIESFDAFHVNISSEEVESLMPKLDALNALRTWELLPEKLRSCTGKNHSEVLAARIIQKSDQIRCAMAMYGSQHLIPFQLLKAKGLHTYLIRDDNHVCDRYISPWEFLAAMGHSPTIHLPTDLGKAFRIAGNVISTWHAFLQIAKTSMLSLDIHGFPNMSNIDGAFQKLNNCRLHLSMYQEVEQNGYKTLKSMAFTASPVRKRAKRDGEVSPTIPFVSEAANPMQAKTDFFTRKVTFEQDLNMKVSSHCKGGIAIFKHEQGHWMVTSHGCQKETISVLFSKALPHALTKHFDRFLHDDLEVEWNSEIQCCPPAFVIFKPNMFDILFRNTESGQEISCKVDLTWTAKTAIAYIATQLKVLPDSLYIAVSGLPLREDDFLMEFSTESFSFGFRACQPAYLFESQTPNPVVHDLRPAHGDCIRVSAKHPTSKVIRTIAVSRGCTLQHIVQGLFPDLCVTTAWTLAIEGQQLGQDISLNDLSKDRRDLIELQWNCLRPLSVTPLVFSWNHHTCDTAGYINYFGEIEKTQRWIKSPFHAKAHILWIPNNERVIDVAASWVVHTQIKSNMLATVNGQPIDPMTKMNDVDQRSVLSFRFCPLNGGGKKNVHENLAELLTSHGVPKDVIGNRVKEFVSKATIEAFAGIDFSDGDSAWDEVKSIANQNSFRLVAAHELRERQKSLRKVKPPSNIQAKKSRRDHGPLLFDPNNVVIHPGHFWDGKDNVNILDASRFGPDQCGLLIVPTHDVDNYLRSKPKSVDGLAILAIGKDAWKYGETFTVPAHNKAGEPLIVTGALVQCGDRPVEFRANVPEMKLEAIPATVIEFTILRKHVTNWKETSIPLRFLGIHLPPIRGSNIIGAWSIRTFDENRGQVGFEHATSWHGYIKVADELLNGILTRSGHAGIFTIPRTSEKKPDPRFSIVQVPNCNLEDAIKLAEGPHGLGVCIAGQHFAVRCSREHVNDLRQRLAPETAFVQTADFDSEDVLYTVRNVATHIGASDLSTALSSAGWPCKAVRPAGQSAWVVASKKPPAFSHLCVNGGLAFIEPLRKQQFPQLTVTAKEFQVSSTYDCNSGQLSTTTRIAEVRQEMSAQIQQAVEARMAAANERIDALTLELREAQLETKQARDATNIQIAQIQNEQQFMHNRVSEVEGTVQQCSQSIVAQMQSMLNNMQQNIQTAFTNEMCNIKDRVGDVERTVKDKDKRKRPEDDDDM